MQDQVALESIATPLSAMATLPRLYMIVGNYGRGRDKRINQIKTGETPNLIPILAKLKLRLLNQGFQSTKR